MTIFSSHIICISLSKGADNVGERPNMNPLENGLHIVGDT